MEARRYQKEDFEQIKQWGGDWGSKYEADQFPETGFIVEGLAAYFLYKTDSSVCFVENLISNKRADIFKRKHAIELVCDAVIKEARDSGFKIAYATTAIPEVIVRAISMGAITEPKQVLLTKKLSDPSK